MVRVQAFAAVALGVAGLLMWRMLYASDCEVLVLPGAAIILIGLQSFRLLLVERRCFASCFFIPGSALHRYFSGSAWAFVYSMAIALTAGSMLMLDLVTWDVPIIVILVIDAVLLVLFLDAMRQFGRSQFRPEIAPLSAQQVVVQINSLALLAVIAPIEYYSPFPKYLDRSLSLGDNIIAAGNQFAPVCSVSDTALSIQSMQEAFFLVTLLRATQQTGDSFLLFAAWSLFLITGALSVWAFSRLIVQLAVIGGIERGNDDDRAE